MFLALSRPVTIMASTGISFLEPGVVSLPRSGRIAEETWERYRIDIVRQYKYGGKRGVIKALKWIQSQNIQDFDPKSVAAPASFTHPC